MKIENGKYYRTRDGQNVGPMNVPPKLERWSRLVIADGPIGSAASGLDGWYEGGKYLNDEDHDLDLIAEWSDAPAKLMIPLPDEASFMEDGYEFICTGSPDGEAVWIYGRDASPFARLSPVTARDFAAAIIAYADAIDARPKD